MRGRIASSAVVQAERVVRNYQLSQGDDEGITVPTWLFFLGLGVGIGMITGPSIMGMTETGAKRLREIAEERLRK